MLAIRAFAAGDTGAGAAGAEAAREERRAAVMAGDEELP